MQTMRLTDDMVSVLVQAGYSFPGKKSKPKINNVTLDSRFTDGELVELYQTLDRLEQDPKWVLRCMLVRFALGTGLRESEITRVRFSVSPENDKEAEAHYNGVITVRNGKGGKSRDACCIPELLPHYQAFIDEQRVRAIKDGAALDGILPLFGKQYERTTMWRWWGQVLNECPDTVRRLRFHDLRHTWGSWEALRVPLSTLKGLGGWSKSSDTFESRYNGVIAELAYGGQIKWRKVALGRFV